MLRFFVVFFFFIAESLAQLSRCQTTDIAMQNGPVAAESFNNLWDSNPCQQLHYNLKVASCTDLQCLHSQRVSDIAFTLHCWEQNGATTNNRITQGGLRYPIPSQIFQIHFGILIFISHILAKCYGLFCRCELFGVRSPLHHWSNALKSSLAQS